MYRKFDSQNPSRDGPPFSITSLGVPDSYFLKLLTNWLANFLEVFLKSSLSVQVLIGFKMDWSLIPLQFFGIERLNPGTYSYSSFSRDPL